MYKFSRDWEPTTDILQVMGWPVACSQNDFMTCPSVKPPPLQNTSTVVPPLGTRKSHSAIVVQGPFNGTIPSSKTSSMSSTCAVALNHTAPSKLDVYGLGVHPELDALVHALPSPTASCSAGLSVTQDIPATPPEILSFDSGDIAKALEIMNVAIQDIPVDDLPSFDANAEATVCSPLASLRPMVPSDLKDHNQSLSFHLRDSPSIWSTSACNDHALSSTLLDAHADIAALGTMSLSSGLDDHPPADWTHSTLGIYTPSRACLRGFPFDDSSPTSSSSSSSSRFRRPSKRPTSGSSEASTSTAVTGSSGTFVSPSSSRGSWGKLSGKVKGWWSTLSGGKGVRRRGKRRTSDASSASR